MFRITAAVAGMLAVSGAAFAQQHAGTTATAVPQRAPAASAPASTAPATTTAPVRTTPATSAAAGSVQQYNNEADAKRGCGTDTVVWANLDSKILHPMSDQYYGHTKKGAYVCQSAAEKDGMHMSGSGTKKAPTKTAG